MIELTDEERALIAGLDGLGTLQDAYRDAARRADRAGRLRDALRPPGSRQALDAVLQEAATDAVDEASSALAVASDAATARGALAAAIRAFRAAEFAGLDRFAEIVAPLLAPGDPMAEPRVGPITGYPARMPETGTGGVANRESGTARVETAPIGAATRVARAEPVVSAPGSGMVLGTVRDYRADFAASRAEGAGAETSGGQPPDIETTPVETTRVQTAAVEPPRIEAVEARPAPAAPPAKPSTPPPRPPTMLGPARDFNAEYEAMRAAETHAAPSFIDRWIAPLFGAAPPAGPAPPWGWGPAGPVPPVRHPGPPGAQPGWTPPGWTPPGWGAPPAPFGAPPAGGWPFALPPPGGPAHGPPGFAFGTAPPPVDASGAAPDYAHGLPTLAPTGPTPTSQREAPDDRNAAAPADDSYNRMFLQQAALRKR